MKSGAAGDLAMVSDADDKDTANKRLGRKLNLGDLPLADPFRRCGEVFPYGLSARASSGAVL